MLLVAVLSHVVTLWDCYGCVFIDHRVRKTYTHFNNAEIVHAILPWNLYPFFMRRYLILHGAELPHHTHSQVRCLSSHLLSTHIYWFFHNCCVVSLLEERNWVLYYESVNRPMVCCTAFDMVIYTNLIEKNNVLIKLEYKWFITGVCPLLPKSSPTLRLIFNFPFVHRISAHRKKQYAQNQTSSLLASQKIYSNFPSSILCRCTRFFYHPRAKTKWKQLIISLVNICSRCHSANWNDSWLSCAGASRLTWVKERSIKEKKRKYVLFIPSTVIIDVLTLASSSSLPHTIRTNDEQMANGTMESAPESKETFDKHSASYLYTVRLWYIYEWQNQIMNQKLF